LLLLSLVRKGVVTVTNPLITKVKHVLQMEDAVLFVGAGSSVWSELPSWGKLIDELADYIEAEGGTTEMIRKTAKSNLFQAATYGYAQLSKVQFSHFIRQACRVNSSSVHEVQRKIVRLGPSCIITTNYDRLLELAYQDENHTLLRPVTNRQPTDAFDIIQANSRGFIFKPHGDVFDTDSVILTQEQYNDILYGERRFTTDALKTLLVSRPIVFLGFGLCDFDFVFLQGLLKETYGVLRDHYAIMADMTNEETTVWKKTYGIHILSYKTTERPDGSRDHSGFVQLLDELLSPQPVPSSPVGSKPVSDESSKVLSLVRYSERLMVTLAIQSDLEFPLQVRLDGNYRKRFRYETHPFDYSRVEDLLLHHRENTVLLGAPGAGKTYSLRKYCVAIAKSIRDSCVADGAIPKVAVPVFLDLKLYSGDLWSMARQSLPSDLDLQTLCDREQVEFILDSLNETPREYFDNGQLDADIGDFLRRIGKCRVVIGSRNCDGISRLSTIPTFALADIDVHFVRNHLAPEQARRGTLGREVLDILRKPLFFRLYQNGVISLASKASPRQLYDSLFDRLSADFAAKTGANLDLRSALSPVAFTALTSGQEVLASAVFENAVVSALFVSRCHDVKASDVINWLISKEILAPSPGLRLAFFHQSVTEYLAAMKFVDVYRQQPKLLEECIKETRWDQALLFTLGFLTDEEAVSFVQTLYRADWALAIKAAKYAELAQEGVVSYILGVLTPVSPVNSFWLDQLPITTQHVPRLWEMFEWKGRVAGAAAGLIARVAPPSVLKERLVTKLFQPPWDSDFWGEAGYTLGRILSLEELGVIFDRLWVFESADDTRGLVRALDGAFYIRREDDVLSIFPPWNELGPLRMTLLCNAICQPPRTAKKVQLAIELANAGVESTPQLMWWASPGTEDTDFDPSKVDMRVIDQLVKALSDPQTQLHAHIALQSLSQFSDVVAERVSETASRSNPILCVILRSFVSDRSPDAFYSSLENLADFGCSPVSATEIMGLKRVVVDWTHHTALLLRLLELGNSYLSTALLTPLMPRRSPITQTWTVQLARVERWLLQMQKASTSSTDSGESLKEAMGYFLVRHTPPDQHLKYLTMFNDPACPFRPELADYVLKWVPNLTTDMMSPSALQFLLEQLSTNDLAESLLGYCATEQYVMLHLLPMAQSAEEPIKTNSMAALRMAGTFHRKRYVPELSND
jgi:hypothetical protein